MQQDIHVPFTSILRTTAKSYVFFHPRTKKEKKNKTVYRHRGRKHAGA